MEISSFDGGNSFIHIPREELDGRDLADVLRELTETGDCAYYDVFENPDGAIAFGRALRSSPIVCAFADFEGALTAMRRLSDDTVSFLGTLGGRYLLFVYPFDAEPPIALCEFASPSYAHPNILRHVAEHGRVLCGPDAVREMKRVFEG
ncbi:MAG: hypothetical protein LBN02_10310 [Oscillospiraceae bacterium]|jgi:hypothetical protein|nr:hypothetical protein [Oscillospiraceae bacterium]